MKLTGQATKNNLYLKGSNTIQFLNTGEILETEIVIKTVKSNDNFWKLYLSDLLGLLGLMNSKQIDVIIYILDHLEPNMNRFIGTYDKIQKDTKVSRDTINKVFKKMKDLDLIVKEFNGVWHVSPRLIMKGSHQKKGLLIRYQDEIKYQNEVNQTNEREENNQELEENNQELVEDNQEIQEDNQEIQEDNQEIQEDNEKIFLNYKYDEYQSLKMLGAFYDKDTKKLYITNNHNLDDFQKWIIK